MWFETERKYQIERSFTNVVPNYAISDKDAIDYIENKLSPFVW